MKHIRSKEHKIPILFIIPSLCRAGAETQIVNLLNSLDCNKFDIHLFTYLDNIDQYSRLQKNRINFYNIVRKNRFDFRTIKSISYLIDKIGIAILHCTFTHATFLGWLARIFSKTKPRLVSAIHTTVHKSFKANFYDRVLYQWILRACDCVIFVSRHQKEFWVAKYPFLCEKSEVVYNGVDTSHFCPQGFETIGLQVRRNLGIPNNKGVLCCLANFRPEKSHDILINAFERFSSRFFLLLVGDGETKRDIEALVKARKMSTSVKFIGEVADVRPILAASNVSVLSSTAVETFSIAMLESMSMGVPMVATDIGGLSEAIRHEQNGYLVPVGNEEALAEAFAQIFGDQTRLTLMGKKCRETVCENFSAERMIAATELVLLKVLEA